MTIIADIFNDESKRSSMLGVYNGGMSAVGAAIGYISGFVATLGWTMVFRIYLVAIPILIMIFLFVPTDQVTTATVEKSKNAAADKSNEKMPWAKVIALGAAFLIFGAVYCIAYFQISMIVAEKAIGDVTFIGTLSALGTVGCFITCFLFGKIYGVFKRSTPIIAYTIMALSFGMLYFSSSSIVAVIACTLLGAMYGLGMSYYFMHCTMIVPESRIPMSIGFTSFCMSIGTFLSVYLATFLQGVMGVTTITEIMPVLIAILAIGAALSAVFTIKDRKTGLVSNLEPELSE
jgi:predicted MFS family arabinose efflux permease